MAKQGKIITISGIDVDQVNALCLKEFECDANVLQLCDRKFGFLLCRGIFLPDRTSSKAISLSPLEKSVYRSLIEVPACLRCSLTQRVNVFS